MASGLLEVNTQKQINPNLFFVLQNSTDFAKHMLFRETVQF